MALTLTQGAEEKRGLITQTPSLVLEIEGYPKLFTTGKLKRYLRVGSPGVYIDGSLEIGSTYIDDTVLDWISVQGTTSSIAQQLLQDKGGTSSITSFQISLVDISEKATQLISPGFDLTDVLGRQAFVYIGYADTLFPEDHVLLFTGIIDEVETGQFIKLNIANPESKKRQSIFANIETATNGAINNSVTTIPLDSVANLLLPVAGILETYVKIDDEIIKYTGKNTTTNQITGCTRAQFGTIAASHNDDASTSSFLRFTANAIDLALYLMLSGGPEYYKEDFPVSKFGQDGDGNAVANGIYFAGINMVTKWGLTVGSKITTTGATNAGNNFSLRTIQSITTNAAGTVVVVDGAALTLETTTTALADFKSQYNVLPDGLGMGAHEVDVDEFLRVKQLYDASIPDFDFYITDTIDGKTFIDTEIFFPSNLFSIPRKGRASVGAVSPPLAIASLSRLDSDTVTKPDSIKIRRALGKHFYNTVIYKYDFDAVETDKPLHGYIKVDTDSQARIPIGTKALTITAKGLRDSVDTRTLLDINSRRLLEKYKYAAEAITVSCVYSEGFTIDVGDIVYFGGLDLTIPDSTRGARGFTPRLCEVIDKRMNIFTGAVDLVLLDTSYLASGRYGIFSPSSIIGVGSTATSLVLTSSYGTTAPAIERDKWLNYRGETIRVRSANYGVTYETKLLGFDPVDSSRILVDALPASPSAGYIVDVGEYPDSADPTLKFAFKNIFVFADPTVQIASGADDTTFTVATGKGNRFTVGATVIVHNSDWTAKSEEVKVTLVSGDVIQVDRSLGFIPSSAYYCDLIGFKDSGPAYRYI